MGFILMLILSRVDYHIFKRYSRIILMIAVVMLVAVLVPQIGFKVGNARRWFNFGFSLFQPSEFAKLALIFYLAAWFETREFYLGSFYYGLLTPLLATGLIGGLVILQPDFGSMTALFLIAFALFFAGGARLSHLLGISAAALGLFWMAIQAAPYRLERIITFFNPSEDRLGAAYQINQALLGIGSGGMWGLGFGNSRQKFNFLPEPLGDSIFAIMSEELGFARVAVIIVLFLALILSGYKLARSAPDRFGSLVAVGVTSWILIQAGLNIGAIVGLLPLTGLPLPFISFGGSSVLALFFGLGVLLNISRQTR